MAADRREREIRNADGTPDDLEKLPPLPLPADLYPLLDKPVLTRQGRGILWQSLTGRIGVVLDADPTRVEFMDPAELVGAS